MGWLLIGLYILAAASLVLSIYNYVSIQELNKANKFNSQYTRKLDNRLSNFEKIADGKKWRWK